MALVYKVVNCMADEKSRVEDVNVCHMLNLTYNWFLIPAFFLKMRFVAKIYLLVTNYSVFLLFNRCFNFI